MWQSRKIHHIDSQNVKLPYKNKKYFVTGWDYQSLRIKNNCLYLAKPLYMGQIKCKLKFIPSNIVEVELIHKDKYYLAIKYKEPDNTSLIHSNNCAGVDIGEVHAIVSIDNNQNAIIITNKQVRSWIRLKDKHQGKLKSKQSRCNKGSRKYKKYGRAIYNLKYKSERQINDAIHKQSRLFLDFCIKNNIHIIYYGNLDSTTRNTKNKNSNFINHKLNMWCFGKLVQQLENKLSRYGIRKEIIDEAYTSKTCPACGYRNKPKKRRYHCDYCGYDQHRDIVGAMNILNFNTGTSINRYVNLEYLQIA